MLNDHATVPDDADDYHDLVYREEAFHDMCDQIQLQVMWAMFDDVPD